MEKEEIHTDRIPTADERAWVRRILWIAWGINAALGTSALFVRIIMQIRRAELISIGLATLVMVGTHLLIRKKMQTSFMAITMSASGITTGAFLGFMALDILNPRSLGILLSMKWLLAAAFLTFLFLKEMGHEESEALQAKANERQWEEEKARVKSMSKEEQRAYFEQMHKTMQANVEELDQLVATLHRKQKKLLILAGLGLAASIVYWVFLQ